MRGLRPTEIDAAEQLFRGLVVLAVDDAAAWPAGTWRRDHARRGITLWQADCLIAATAWTHGASLATGNPQDFPTRELTVEHWPVGEEQVPRGTGLGYQGRSSGSGSSSWSSRS